MELVRPYRAGYRVVVKCKVVLFPSRHLIANSHLVSISLDPFDNRSSVDQT
jgi:hypothetical protein